MRHPQQPPLIRLLSLALALAAPGAQAASDPDEVWRNGLRTAYFGDRPIASGDGVITLEAPVRAEDPAVVPLSIKAQFPQTDQRYIKTVYLVIDKNPGAMAGKFHFTPRSGRADLSLRVRVNAYSPIRAIAETNDGELHMARRFVKASGGCSAPVGTDLDAALSRLGRMKLRTRDIPDLAEPMQTQLMVSHPNITGLQMDQVSRHYAPAHYVKEVTVSFEGEPVFSAETDFSVSENPSFRFYFVPHKAGELRAEVVDTNGDRFVHTYPVQPKPVESSAAPDRGDTPSSVSLNN